MNGVVGTTFTSTSPAALILSGNVTGTGQVIYNANSTGVITQSGSVNNIGTITNSGTGTAVTTISGIIGTNVASVIQNSTTAQLNLSGVNTFTGNLIIRAGTVSAGINGIGNGNNKSFGNGSVILGDTSGPNASPVTLTGFATSPILANPLVLANIATATGTISVGSNNTTSTFTYSGGITGTNHVVLSATGGGGLSFAVGGAVNNAGTVTSSGAGSGTTTINLLGSNVVSVAQAGVSPFVIASAFALSPTNRTLVSTGSGLFTFSGGITGTENVVFNANSTGGITVSTGGINHSGTITNSGTGTGTATISGAVNSSVTGLIQNSTTSAMTVSGALSVNAAGTTLTNTAGTRLLTLSGGVTGTGNLVIANNSGTANGITFTTGSLNNTGTVTNSGTGTGAETIGVVIGSAVTGVTQNSAISSLILTGTNLYTGLTSVTAGTLTLSGTGSSNSSSGFTVNGSTAKLVQTSSVALTATVTLTQGTLDGTTTIANLVSVANNSGAIVTAGNGGAGTLTIGTLTFNGAATINLAEAGAAVSTKLAVTTLNADGAPGSVFFNVTNSGLYTAGFYDLITYTSLGALDFDQFALGSVSGLAGRQGASLFNSGTAIQLQVTGAAASLVWTGAQSTAWTTTPVGGLKNWTNAGTPDEFVSGDFVTFDDTAIGTTPVAVNIANAGVSPTSTTFNHSAKDYTLGSAGGFGIESGTLTKSGTGKLTITNTNTYSGATTIQNGSVFLGTNDALPVTTALILGNNLTGGSSTQGTLNLQTFNQTVGSLTVQSDSATANQIVIGIGKTLTVNGNVIIGEVNNSKTTPRLTMSGGGALTVANSASGAVFQVGANSTETTISGNTAVVDLSGLSTVTISLNTTNGAVNIGDNVGNTANSGVASSLFLPTTGVGNTTITAATLSVGPQGRNSTSTPFVNVLKLGSGANVFNVTNFNIGGVATGGSGIRDAGSVTFTNGSGTLRLRDTSGTGRANLNIAASSGVNTGATRTNTFDVSGHAVDLLIGTLTIGDGASNTGNQTNLFSFDTGLLDVSTILLARRSGAAHTSIWSTTVNFGSSPSSTGVVTVGAGGITLLNQANTSTTSPVASTLNLLGGTTTVAGDIIQIVTGTGQHTGTVNLDGGTLDMTGKKIGGSLVANNIDVLAFKSGTLKNVAEINNGAGLTKTTAGTLILEGTNTYTGGTAISAGTLQVGTGGTTGTLGSGAITNEGTLSINRSNAVTIVDDITGGGAFVQMGAGITTLSGTNVYTGATTISAGTLQAGAGGTTGTVGSGAITNNGTLSIHRSNAVTISQVISGSGAFIQMGAGTTTLTGTNAYSGGTTVSGGVLLATNTTGSATGSGNVTVDALATLGGTGSAGGGTGKTTAISSGAFLTPGLAVSIDGVATFNVLGNLSLDGQIKLQLTAPSATFTSLHEVGGNLVGDNPDDGFNDVTQLVLTVTGNNDGTVNVGSTNYGTGKHDHLNVTSTFNFGSTGTLQLDLSGYTSRTIGDVFNLFDASSYVNASNFSLSSQINASSGDLFLIDTNLPGNTFADSGLYFDTRYFFSDGLLVVVPEPSRALLLMAGAGLLAGRRRRRLTK